MARIRNKNYNTVHHLTSRIAHRAFFLKSEERDDFIRLMKRVSAFSGIELLGWCILDNHFHVFVYLPTPPVLSDEEVLRRFALLKGASRRVFIDEKKGTIPLTSSVVVPEAAKTGGECQTPPANSRDNFVKSIRRRMYSIAEYMRMIKKWFSDDYNSRNGHKGTMWEAVYGDRALTLPDSEGNYDVLRDILAYIHLNPIRAAVADRFDGYEWSSYSAFVKGDVVAAEAIRRIYPGTPDDEIRIRHERRMGSFLESWKLQRAVEIARKREIGYEMPTDPVTDECMVAQARAHAKEVQKAIMLLHAELDLVQGTKARREIIYRQICCELELHPDFTAHDLALSLNVPERTVQRYVADLRKNGKVHFVA